MFYVPNPFGNLNYHHHGHTHFFMLGLDFNAPGADAFSGHQTYDFRLDDIWGPRSGDPNQAEPYRVIGTPKWKFHIQEVWRRVYVQPWDLKVGNASSFLQQRGVKWDASPADKIHGPFRETLGYAPVYVQNARTLPLEYFNRETKGRKERDNYVMSKAQQMIAEWNASPLGARFPKTFDPQTWNLDHGNYVDYNTPPGRPSFPDALYIYPIIEYQTVTQLDWERLPGYEAAHDIDADNFGDGWTQQIQIPFKNPVTGKYNSPFGPQPGVCKPVGEYFGVKTNGDPLVPLASRPKHRKRNGPPPDPDHVPPYYPEGNDFHCEPFSLPAFDPADPAWQGVDGGPVTGDTRDNLSEQPVTFHDPHGVNDGKWVQQCLGGIVQAQAIVTIEHKLGGRRDVVVSATQYLPTTAFEGADQLMPANP
jgi:hypothetical protein